MNMKSFLLASTAILTLSATTLIADSASAQVSLIIGDPQPYNHVEPHYYRPTPYYKHHNYRHRNLSYWERQRESQKRRDHDGHDNGNHYGQKKHDDRNNGNHGERNRGDHDNKDYGKGKRSYR